MVHSDLDEGILEPLSIPGQPLSAWLNHLRITLEGAILEILAEWGDIDPPLPPAETPSMCVSEAALGLLARTHTHSRSRTRTHVQGERAYLPGQATVPPPQTQHHYNDHHFNYRQHALSSAQQNHVSSMAHMHLSSLRAFHCLVYTLLLTLPYISCGRLNITVGGQVTMHWCRFRGMVATECFCLFTTVRKRVGSQRRALCTRRTPSWSRSR